MQQHYPHSILSRTISSSPSLFRTAVSSSSSLNGLIFEFSFFKGKTRYQIRAVERESGFEIDRDKAREALQKLDQQFQSTSIKQINTPKIRAPEVNFERDLRMKEEEPEFTGVFLPYTALVLFIFTVFYNIYFYKVIVPSVDGPPPELSPPSVPMILSDKYYSPGKSPWLKE